MDRQPQPAAVLHGGEVDGGGYAADLGRGVAAGSIRADGAQAGHGRPVVRRAHTAHRVRLGHGGQNDNPGERGTEHDHGKAEPPAHPSGCVGGSIDRRAHHSEPTQPPV
jgi:hypothetical protein